MLKKKGIKSTLIASYQNNFLTYPIVLFFQSLYLKSSPVISRLNKNVYLRIPEFKRITTSYPLLVTYAMNSLDLNSMIRQQSPLIVKYNNLVIVAILHFLNIFNSSYNIFFYFKNLFFKICSIFLLNQQTSIL
jgi:hypothetical protein